MFEPKKTRRKGADLDQLSSSVHALADPSLDPLQVAKALFAFVSYIRWPDRYYTQRVAQNAFLAKWLVRQSLQKHFAADLILENVNLPQLVDFATSEMRFDLDFGVFRTEYRNERMIAETIQFLMMWSSEENIRTKRASVKKAFFLRNRGYYGSERQISWWHFQDYWFEYKEVCAFHYVNEFHFHCRFLLDPSHPKFVQRVNRLIGDFEARKRFFRKSRFVFELLTEKLDRRVFVGCRLPRFPSDLTPFPFAVAPPDERMRELIADYSSPQIFVGKKHW